MAAQPICEELNKREEAALKRLLATPPDHSRTKPKPGASPKRRGRPPKVGREPHKGLEK
jgi:hypothetical protein